MVHISFKSLAYEVMSCLINGPSRSLMVTSYFHQKIQKKKLGIFYESVFIWKSLPTH